MFIFFSENVVSEYFVWVYTRLNFVKSNYYNNLTAYSLKKSYCIYNNNNNIGTRDVLGNYSMVDIISKTRLLLGTRRNTYIFTRLITNGKHL